MRSALDNPLLRAALIVALTLGLLILGYFVGGLIERRHFARLARREAALRDITATTTQRLPGAEAVRRAGIVYGHAVISLDYFKAFTATLRALVGGRVAAYTPLLERGRREAMVRMLDQAKAAGYDAVVGVRLETSRIASRLGNNATAGVEMLAYGTAIALDRGTTARPTR